jgi:23S rRNA pseudouridine955/2504/2580 synthase
MSDQKRGKGREFSVPADRDGQRIDNFLIRRLKGVPKALIYRLIRKKAIRVNGSRAKPDRRLRAGDVVHVPDVRQAERSAADIPPKVLEILRQRVVLDTGDYLVLDKPAGMAVHAGSGLNWGVIEAMRQIFGANLELAHRLDRGTSGCLVLTRNRHALLAYNDAQKAGLVEKHYHLLVLGIPQGDTWDADMPLLKTSGKGGQPQVAVDDDGQSALTHFRLLERLGDYSLVQASLATGRMHQIRVHACETIGPIVGDDRYGDHQLNRQLQDFGLARMFLHCQSMQFPAGDDEVIANAPLPEELGAFVNELSLSVKSRK